MNQYNELPRTIVITYRTDKELYQNRLPDCPTNVIGETEKIKTIETVADIFSQLVDLEADRSSFILGIGGGIVCDITGFAASTFMRGSGFGFVSTTLLAQVDASVGGKNGVNFGGFKNMVGVFNQPEFVICDLGMLKTLPQREIRSGFAEIIKHGAIADRRMLDLIEETCQHAHFCDDQPVEMPVWCSFAQCDSYPGWDMTVCRAKIGSTSHSAVPA